MTRACTSRTLVQTLKLIVINKSDSTWRQQCYEKRPLNCTMSFGQVRTFVPLGFLEVCGLIPGSFTRNSEALTQRDAALRCRKCRSSRGSRSSSKQPPGPAERGNRVELEGQRHDRPSCGSLRECVCALALGSSEEKGGLPGGARAGSVYGMGSRAENRSHGVSAVFML